MGNRAVIAFDDQLSSTGIYLHWNGGIESVLAFLAVARELGVRCPGEHASYAASRLTQIIANFFGGTLSIGVGPVRDLDCDNGDNGTYVVSYDWDIVRRKHSRDQRVMLEALSQNERDSYDATYKAAMAKNKPIFEEM